MTSVPEKLCKHCENKATTVVVDYISIDEYCQICADFYSDEVKEKVREVKLLNEIHCINTGLLSINDLLIQLSSNFGILSGTISSIHNHLNNLQTDIINIRRETKCVTPIVTPWQSFSSYFSLANIDYYMKDRIKYGIDSLSGVLRELVKRKDTK